MPGEGEALLSKGHLVDDAMAGWNALNLRVQHALIGAHDSTVIAEAIAHNNHLPFASADCIGRHREALPAEYQRLRVAQLQHRLVFDARVRRESVRVEIRMREHAWVVVRHAELLAPSAPAPAPSQPPAPAPSAPTSATRREPPPPA